MARKLSGWATVSYVGLLLSWATAGPRPRQLSSAESVKSLRTQSAWSEWRRKVSGLQPAARTRRDFLAGHESLECV
jgi:hypothetical protein